MRKKLIYHLGQEAGFYSEFNNMVLGILYCMKHDIDFVLYSCDANFKYKDGWNDYFLPFCTEVTDSFHSIFNVRQKYQVPRDSNFMTQATMYSIAHKFDYYTFELFDKFRSKEFEKETFVIEGQEMNLLDASKYIINKIYRYNEQTQEQVDKLINSLNLPDNYAGIHIRCGDKICEHELVTPDTYMNKIKQLTDLHNIFVFTDDYSVIEYLKNNYKDYNFYTLTGENEHGYNHRQFINTDIDFKKNQIIKMFASVDVLSKSNVCLGTFSSNPGMYLGMVMPEDKMFGIDFDKWRIW